MPGLFIPRGFQKPARSLRLNSQCSLAGGLTRLWTFDALEGNAQQHRDLVYGDILTNSRVQADTRIVSSDRGLVYEAGASSPYDRITGTQVSGFGAHSVTIAVSYKHHTTNGFLASYSNVVSGATTLGRAPRLYVSATEVSFQAVQDSVGAQGATLPMTVTAGTWYTMIGRYVRDTGIATYAGTWDVCVNGAWSATNNNTALAAFGGTFTSTLWYAQHDETAVPGDSNHLFFDYIAIWDRALSNGECDQMLMEPYSMLTL